MLNLSRFITSTCRSTTFISSSTSTTSLLNPLINNNAFGLTSLTSRALNLLNNSTSQSSLNYSTSYSIDSNDYDNNNTRGGGGRGGGNRGSRGGHGGSSRGGPSQQRSSSSREVIIDSYKQSQLQPRTQTQTKTATRRYDNDDEDEGEDSKYISEDNDDDDTTQLQQQVKDIDGNEKKLQRRHWHPLRNLMDNDVWRVIEQMQWSAPTDIQLELIPNILKCRNILASSKTGSGKTASYAIPMIQIVHSIKKKIASGVETTEAAASEGGNSPTHIPVIVTEKKLNGNDPLGLVIVPSRELAIQVSEEVSTLSQHMDLRVQTIFGGVGEHTQLKNIGLGVDIVVGTPGRILQLVKDGQLNLRQVHITVIDEFDKLFNYGFFPDTKELFDSLPLIQNRSRDGMQTVLISATVMHEKHDGLISRFSPNHTMVNLNPELQAPSQVRQHFYHVSYRKKRSLLLYFFRRSKGKTSLKHAKVLIFARTQQRVENLCRALEENKIKAISIHADFSPAKRAEAVEKFKSDEYQVLVATDVMARGVHIENLDAVVNFDVPHVSEDYLHRIGRAGRLGQQGFALTFVSRQKLVFEVGKRTVGLDEKHLVSNIEKVMAKDVRFSKVPGPWVEEGGEELDHDIRVKSEDRPYDDHPHQHQQHQQQQQDHNESSTTTGDYTMDKEQRHHQRKENKAVADLLIQKNILETYKGPKSMDGMPRVRFNPNAKVKNRKMSKLKIDRKGEILDLPPITDFEEGRYEAVIEGFDKKRAKRLGVGVKMREKKVFKPSRIVTKRQMKRNDSQQGGVGNEEASWQ
ncbi:hypothetical protein SAMD00019534_086590 [Acytostelium subglobosum LB1]|uniref:hypothetical protein n=1 Tax=Acytostelium subglobosum LB1 TaxID=1410327 RepID=UPI0006448325|nr:hypothetical protein SAMD00019534_086590 [Acytostelium subglobosum LB1]GAM25484.1 hypothetical protein SAMD00019534_086590 [Acytostelium subglobosum LB1]|eukprot:XP_012751470.1 hypothetical protein SAMD00019534_086590 [Acytostelium subglobosum LB1]